MNTRKSFIKFLAPAALALIAFAPGCIGHTGPSAIGQGQEYRSGDPNFDQFFADLHDMQVDMASAPKEEKENRIALAKKLGIELEEEAPPPAAAPPAQPQAAPAAAPTPAVPGQPSVTDQLGQSAVSSVPLLGQLNQVKNQVTQVKNQVTAAKAQVDQMRALSSSVGSAAGGGQTAAATPAAPAKPELRAPSAALIGRTVKQKAEALAVQLSLAVDEKALGENEVKTELRTAPQALEGDGRTLADAVHDATRSELKLYLRMEKAKRDLDKLQMLAGALENMVDTSFRKGGASKKSEVRKNLQDARAVIKLMQERASDVSSKTKEVVQKLEESASAKIEEPVPESPPVDSEQAAKTEPQKPEPEAAPVKKTKHASAPKPRTTVKAADFEP